MKVWGLIIAAIFAAFVTIASPAAAEPVDASRCSATVPDSGASEAWLKGDVRWTCPADFSDLSATGHAVRFRWDPGRETAPAFLVSRVAAFESLTVFAKNDAGDWRGTTHAFSDISAAYLDRQFVVPLEGLSPDAAELVVVISAPSQAIPLDYLRLTENPPGTNPHEFGALLIIALVCGLILMPLLFDFIFWRVLRKSFILWHAVFVCAVGCQLIFTAGLYLPALQLKIDGLQAITVSSFGILVISGMMFICSFLEKDALSLAMRRWMVAGAAMMGVVTVLLAPSFGSLGSWPVNLFYVVGAAITVINLFAAVQAWRRDSRYIRYIIIGFAPLFAVAVLRVVSFWIPGIPADDMNGLFLIGVLIEASATAFGVAARFVHLKHERDVALIEAQTMGELAERDPLTGLLNRRFIGPRFKKLHRSGYETIAILDLDHFKRINDTYGHARGDDVLRAVASALESDDNVLATRIGGEEFMLLLRGKDGLERAERIRQSIPVRVARDVATLDQPVTASMGVVCVPPGAMPKAGFSDFYEMADKLLYEAKEQGRNRHVAERLRTFRKRGGDRRQQAAA